MTKRLIDIVVSLTMAIILSPLIIFVALSAFILMGRPIIFKQLRPGFKCVPFYIYKIRTMKQLNRDGLGVVSQSDEGRLTTFGRLIRKTSLDETPQLWNVLKGDMSLVGPRPLLMDYLPLYSEEQKTRQNVKPGITGWAQINGRNNLSWGEKFELDLWYVRHQSVSLDIKILYLTIFKVLISEGISSKESVVSEKFEGNKVE